MKTILYQPLFINPQAYFVFPQLYHIEKGDSYHDEGSGADSYYKHVYDNLIVEYIKGEHTQYLSKPLGSGGNLHADIIIKNCIFKNGKENVSDVSWHFPNNANYKFTITGNRFSYRFSLDSDVEKCNILFTNNSHKEDNVFANATVMQFNNVKE